MTHIIFHEWNVIHVICPPFQRMWLFHAFPKACLIFPHLRKFHPSSIIDPIDITLPSLPAPEPSYAPHLCWPGLRGASVEHRRRFAAPGHRTGAVRLRAGPRWLTTPKWRSSGMKGPKRLPSALWSALPSSLLRAEFRGWARTEGE